jgi:hypothetical protein
VRSVRGTYPSPFEIHATWNDSAALGARGDADFPRQADTKGARQTSPWTASLLAPLDAMARHANVRIKRGTLSAKGEVEIGRAIASPSRR